LNEEWKSFDEWYDVSSLGRVRSWRLEGWQGKGKRREIPKILTPRPDRNGYLRWQTGRNGRDESIHRVVAELFIGPAPSSSHEVAHNNGNRKDNRVTNLRWATKIENQQDKIKHGTYYRTHLNDVMVRGIRTEHSLGYGTTYTIAERYSVSQTTVARILRKETWAHV
jgi:hypothetical protein